MKLTKETLESIIQEELEDLFEEEELEEEKRPWWDLGYGDREKSYLEKADDYVQSQARELAGDSPTARGQNVGIGGNIAPKRVPGKHDKKPVKRTRPKPSPYKKSYIPKWEE